MAGQGSLVKPGVMLASRNNCRRATSVSSGAGTVVSKVSDRVLARARETGSAIIGIGIGMDGQPGVFFWGGGHNHIVKVIIRPAQVQSRRISSVKHALSHCPSARPVGWLAPYPAAQIAGCAGASGHGVPWRASAPRELGPGLQKRGGGLLSSACQAFDARVDAAMELL